jgi:hypothetical protein
MERNKKELNSQSKSAFSTKDQTIPNFIQNSQFNSNNNNINSNNNNFESDDNEEISYYDHIICANCIEKELQKDAQNYENRRKQDKIFHCKICDVDHVIECSQWNKIFKKGCCSSGCDIF